LKSTELATMSLTRFFAPLLFLLISLSCKQNTSSNSEEILPQPRSFENLNLKHASGFSVDINQDIKILTVKNPWPEAEKTYKYALVDRKVAPSITLNKNDYDGIILTPVKKIVVTSTTHIPALELLGVEEALVGFPGTDYISSKVVRKRIESKQVRDLGKNEGINTEVLLEVQPEAVVAFGIDGNNRSMNTLQKSGIPVIYNGDWVEKSPLAKAEWIKFFGVLFNKENIADSIFSQIETDYKNAKKIATQIKNQPTVLCGAMHEDVWYLPSGTSPEAQFLNDANVNYLWSETQASGSLALSFEAVFKKAKDADLWLSPSYYKNLKSLEKANPHYAEFKAFKEKNVYSFSKRTGETGGVMYYELGTARPDLVLKDMIKVCHPELLDDYKTTFFEKLE